MDLPGNEVRKRHRVHSSLSQSSTGTSTTIEHSKLLIYFDFIILITIIFMWLNIKQIIFFWQRLWWIQCFFFWLLTLFCFFRKRKLFLSKCLNFRSAIDYCRQVHFTQDSIFSGSSGWKDFRGFFNLAMLLLVVSNGRVALENLLTYILSFCLFFFLKMQNMLILQFTDLKNFIQWKI